MRTSIWQQKLRERGHHLFKIRGVTYCEEHKKQFKNERGFNFHWIMKHAGQLRKKS